MGAMQQTHSAVQHLSAGYTFLQGFHLSNLPPSVDAISVPATGI
jgi:hypothetical protein